MLAPNVRKDRGTPPIPTERPVRIWSSRSEARGHPEWTAQGTGREAGPVGWGQVSSDDSAPRLQVRQRISSLLQDAQTQAALVLDWLEARQE